LNCVRTWDFPLKLPGDPARLLPIVRQRLGECAQDVHARGVDLAGYNTEQSADDLEALRRVLGVKRIRLWAVSYGTHLALSAIRRHPASIERAVLVGLQGPDDGMMRSPAAADAQIARLTEHLKADPESRNLFPDLREQLASLLAELDETPAIVPVLEQKTGQKLETAVGRWDLAFFTRPRISQTWGVRSLPEFLGPLLNHDFLPLAAAAFDYRRGPVGSMMAWATICASGVSQDHLRKIQHEAENALLGAAANFPFPEACGAIKVRPLGREFRSPVRSKVPVLFISGSLDGQTPPHRAEEIARGFSRGSSLIVPGASHGFDLFYFRPEVKAAMLEFLTSR
jgi:pimeloyl-ACP methyl ester carboxylesterase